MAQSAAAQLACRLIREHYGEVNERVCQYLVSKGLSALPEIVRGTGLSPPLVKQSLLVLVQHNWVSAYLHTEDPSIRSSRPPYSLYLPHLDRMLQILRMPKFLLHIKEEMDDVAEMIIELLLQMGRLSIDQISKGVSARLQRAPEEAREVVRNTLISLVQSHYVERAPPCTLPVPLVAPHPNSIKKRSTKSGSEQMAADQSLALRSLEELTFEKERFRLPQELLLESMMEGVPGRDGAEGSGSGAADGADAVELKLPPAKKQKIKAGSKAGAKGATAGTQANGSAAPGAASTSAAAAAASAAGPSRSNPTGIILWRVNTEEFNRRFRHRACVEMVTEKIDTDAGSVLAAMFAASRAYETKLQAERSTTLSVEEISSSVLKLTGSNSIPKLGAEVPVIINTIAHDSLELISYAGDGPGGEQYVVNMQRIIDLIRLKQLEAVIRDRFGNSGLRIFRLLLLKGQLEQKQISDFSMLPAKEVRQLLYRMLQAGFLALQDIPKSSDRAPSRTFYTWRVDIKAATERLGSELYRALHNVWARLKFEMDREKEVLSLLEEARETGQLNFTLTAAQKGSITRLKKVSDVLEASMLHIDDMVAVFNNF